MKHWGFTRHERRIIIILLIAVAAGTGVQYYKSRIALPEEFIGDARMLTTFFEVHEDSAANFRREAQPDAPDQRRDKPIDINRATAQELQSLRHIGPVIAKRIVAYREQHGAFSATQDLKRVKGIGEKIFADINPFIKI